MWCGPGVGDKHATQLHFILAMSDKPKHTTEAEKICQDFVNLTSKGKHLFTSLTELPVFANWDSYFHRSFDVYDKVNTFTIQCTHTHV